MDGDRGGSLVLVCSEHNLGLLQFGRDDERRVFLFSFLVAFPFIWTCLVIDNTLRLIMPLFLLFLLYMAYFEMVFFSVNACIVWVCLGLVSFHYCLQKD